MKLKMICALVMMLIGANAQALIEFGGHDGNGGGGFCNQGVCKTAAEAGIKIRGSSTTPDYWIMPSDVLNELQRITASLPLGGKEILKKSFGDPDTYMIVDSVKDRALKEIKKNYIDVMKENGFSPSAGVLEIFAVSDSEHYTPDNKTYLLPSFFKLSARQKALILIHEGNIRNRSSLTEALEFDSLLLSYLKDPRGLSFDYLRFLGSIDWQMNQNDRDSSKLFALVVDFIQRQSGRRLTLANFRDSDFLPGFPLESPVSEGGLDRIGPMAVAKSSAAFGPRFSKIFAKTTMRTIATNNGKMWTVDAADVGNACQGREGLPGFEKWPLIPLLDADRSLVVAVDCSKKSKGGVYSGYIIAIWYLNLGNRIDHF